MSRIDVVKTEVFKFNELSEDAKQKAVEKLWDINLEHDWWECIYDNAENAHLKINGFDINRGGHIDMKFILDATSTAHKITDEHGESCNTYETAKEYFCSRRYYTP